MSEAKTAPQKTIDVSSQSKQDLQVDVKQATVGVPFCENPKMSMRNVNVFYGDKQAIHDVSVDIAKNEVIAMIGPSGCGKSTFLRTLNRMNDTVDTCKVSGNIQLDSDDIYQKGLDVVELRARVGMVFQKPNPFPKSIFEGGNS